MDNQLKICPSCCKYTDTILFSPATQFKIKKTTMYVLTPLWFKFESKAASSHANTTCVSSNFQISSTDKIEFSSLPKRILWSELVQILLPCVRAVLVEACANALCGERLQRQQGVRSILYNKEYKQHGYLYLRGIHTYHYSRTKGKAKTSSNIMGQLPVEHITPGPIFEKVRRSGLCWPCLYQIWICTQANNCESLRLCIRFSK